MAGLYSSVRPPPLPFSASTISSTPLPMPWINSILYYTILYYTILYYTIQTCGWSLRGKGCLREAPPSTSPYCASTKHIPGFLLSLFYKTQHWARCDAHSSILPRGGLGAGGGGGGSQTSGWPKNLTRKKGCSFIAAFEISAFWRLILGPVYWHKQAESPPTSRRHLTQFHYVMVFKTIIARKM
jgi:hypothetical protein